MVNPSFGAAAFVDYAAGWWSCLPCGNQSTHSFPLLARKLISYSCSCILFLIGLVLIYQLPELNIVGKFSSRRQFVSGHYRVFISVL